MRNLLDRLKPEHIKKLKEAENLYPSTIPSLFMELKSNNFWCDLTYSWAFVLVTHLDLYDYSPTTIQNLFTDEEH